MWNFSNNKWIQSVGQMIKISSASDGSTFGISTDNDIYQWNGKIWTIFAAATGKYNDLCVANANHIVAITTTANFGGFVNMEWQNGQWSTNSGGITNVGCSSDGTVWATNSYNQGFVAARG